MYSFKEKQKHYAELRNPDAAEQDLELLRKKQPELSTLSMFSRNPKRYADDILYALLDVAERDEIRNNRRTVEIAPVQDTKKDISKSTNFPKVEKKKRIGLRNQRWRNPKRIRNRIPKNPKARRVSQNRLGQSLRHRSPNSHHPLQRPSCNLETNEAARRAAGQEPD